jgi:hypothetical protein
MGAKEKDARALELRPSAQPSKLTRSLDDWYRTPWLSIPQPSRSTPRPKRCSR